MAVYKIKSSEITATATNTIISQNVTLEAETLELITGQVLDTNTYSYSLKIYTPNNIA